jgi:hypothetical protein
MVVVTTSNPEKPIWSASESGIVDWDINISGKLAVSEGDLYLIGEDGLYRLNVQDRTSSLLRQFPKTNLQSLEFGSKLGGGFYLLTNSVVDRRLMVVGSDGSLLWERTIEALPRGELRIISQDDTTYLLNFRSNAQGLQIDLYVIEQESNSLSHVLVAGSRQAYVRDVWLMPINQDRLLLNIGGGSLVAFDPESALSVITYP